MDRVHVDLLPSVSLSNVPVRSYHASASSNVVLAAWRRSGLICLLAALSLVVAAAVLAVAKKQYAAEAVVQLNLDKREGGQIDDGGPAVVLDASAVVQGELRIIRSRLIARRVVERLQLASGPDANEGAAAPEGPLRALQAAASQAWQRLRDALPVHLSRAGAPEAPADPAKLRVLAAEDEVMGRMTVEADHRSYLVTIKFTSTDPKRAAQVANALAEEYIARRLEANADLSAKTVEWLDGQIRQVTMQLRGAEATVEAYRAQSGLLELGASETLDQQRLRELAAQRSAASLAHNEAQARLARVRSIVRSGGVPSMDDLKGSPQIRALLDRRTEQRARLGAVLANVGPHHPQAIQAQAALTAADAALAAELQHALQIVQDEVAAAEQAEQETSDRLDKLQQAMIAGKSKETELRGRQYTIQVLQDRLSTLMRSRAQAQAIQQLRLVAASLVVPAELPQEPFTPKPLVVVPVALTGGLGLGVLLAGLLERRDRGFRNGTEVEPALGKRCLGMVPDVPSALQPGKARRSTFETSLLAETARSVGAALGLFNLDRGCRVVLVTSSVAGEGKSVFCRALADCLVASGRRVLLVDGSPHREDAAPGGGEACEADQIPDEDAPMGPGHGGSLTVLRRSNARLLASDVFGSTEFGRLVEETRKHFDVVLMEGAAVMLVADSLVLGRFADTVIHVARWSATKQATVAAALNRLYENSIAVDGVVLTRVNLARHAALKAADIGSYYLKEKRFYEQLLRTKAQRPSKQTRDT